MANGDGGATGTDAASLTTDVAPLPKDVPWRRLATAALSWDPGEVMLTAPITSSMRPSVSVFGYKIPREETREEFPGERIVLLKVVASLTGMRPPPSVLNLPGGSLIPFNIIKAEVAPCIGAVVEVKLTDADDLGNSDKIFIRDVYPRRQESIVHEVIGTETFTRASSSVSTTKSWNVNASATGSVRYGPFSASQTVAGGYSSSKTTQDERERSQKSSRETQVESIYHVLTAYHLGRNEATLAIQPRPFEGENWELLNGFRKLEGIQEFLLVAAVPYDIERLSIKADIVPGFRARVMASTWDTGILPFPGWNKRYWWHRVDKTAEVWKKLEDDNDAWSLFYPPSFPRVKGHERQEDRGAKWTNWMEDYKLYLEVKKFVDEQLWQPYVLVSRFGAQTNLRLHMGSPCEEMLRTDPCDGGPPPYHDVLPTNDPDLQLTNQGLNPGDVTTGVGSLQVSNVWEADVNVGRYGGDRTGQLASTNMHMADLFNAVVAGASAAPTEFRPLSQSTYAARLRNLAEQAASGNLVVPQTDSPRNEPPADGGTGDDEGGGNDGGGSGDAGDAGDEGAPPSVSPGGSGTDTTRSG